ncbi:MAG: glycoside hydrolase family 16 protein, partial [Nocardioides sp.]
PAPDPTPDPDPTPTPDPTPDPTPSPTPEPDPTPDPTPNPDPAPDRVKGWKVDLNDNFDRMDASCWRVRNGSANSNEHSYLQAANVSVQGGLLRIQGKNQSAGGRRYTSGYVDSNGKYSLPNYFRAEVRAKVPMEQGMWAAPLWFRPEDYSGGEIDVVETYGKERDRPKIHHTIHTDYGSGHQKSAKPAYYSAVGDATGTEWHTYTIEKKPGSITIWTDGRQTAQWKQGDPQWFNQYYESGKRWHMRVNLQIGGTWGGLPDGSTDWSGDKTTMMVDYIRTWVPE